MTQTRRRILVILVIVVVLVLAFTLYLVWFPAPRGTPLNPL